MGSLATFMRFLTSESNDKDGAIKVGRLYGLKVRMDDQFQRLFLARKRIRLRKKKELRETTALTSTHLSGVPTRGHRKQSWPTSLGQVASVHYLGIENTFSTPPITFIDPFSVSYFPQQFSLPPWAALTPAGFLPKENDSSLSEKPGPVSPFGDPSNWSTNEPGIGLCNSAANSSAPECEVPISQDVGSISHNG